MDIPGRNEDPALESPRLMPITPGSRLGPYGILGQIGAAVDPGYHQIGRGRQDMARAHDYAMGGSAGDAETTIAKSANAQWGVQADGECDTPL